MTIGSRCAGDAALHAADPHPIAASAFAFVGRAVHVDAWAEVEAPPLRRG